MFHSQINQKKGQNTINNFVINSNVRELEEEMQPKSELFRPLGNSQISKLVDHNPKTPE
jgi:hypothetical protein